jgi:hypothetical protein
MWSSRFFECEVGASVHGLLGAEALVPSLGTLSSFVLWSPDLRPGLMTFAALRLVPTLRLQAPSGFDTISALLKQSEYALSTPNSCRGLRGSFFISSPVWRETVS